MIFEFSFVGSGRGIFTGREQQDSQDENCNLEKRHIPSFSLQKFTSYREIQHFRLMSRNGHDPEGHSPPGYLNEYCGLPCAQMRVWI
jgi:hypothetical protein